MSEPLAIEPEQAPGETPAPPAAAGFGYALAQMRVRVGLSVEQAAARLRLHPRQLRAIEAEDLVALPAAAYVNGFVRNYARELGMDPGPLIDDLNAKLKLRGLIESPPDLGSAGGAQPPLLDDRGWRHLVLAGIVVGLVCAGLIGAWMLRSGAITARPAGAPQRTSGAAMPPAPATPVAEAPPVSPPPAAAPIAADAPPQGAMAAAAGRAPIMVAPTVSTTATPAAAGSTGAPAAAGLPGEPRAEAAAVPAAPPGPSAAVPAAPSGNGPAVSPVVAPVAGLVLRFNDRSWIQVTRPDGRVLLSRNGEAGSLQLLNAPAPLTLVIGRADAVQVEYRGQPVNLKPYANSQGVARLTLGEGQASSGGQSSR